MDKDRFKKTIRTNQVLDPDSIEAYKQRFRAIDVSLEPGYSFYFLFNHNTLEYPYMSGGVEEILGYTQEELNQMDDPYLQFFHTDDLPVYGEKIFPTFRQLRIKNAKDAARLSFQIMGRVQNKDGEVINTLMEYQTLEIDPEMRPVLSFGKLTEVRSPQKVNGIGVSVYKKDGRKTVQIYDDILSFASPTISKREMEVLQLIANGKTGKEIAQVLFISENTVKNHRQNLLKKLDLKSTPELVRYAVEQGLTKTKKR